MPSWRGVRAAGAQAPAAGLSNALQTLGIGRNLRCRPFPAVVGFGAHEFLVTRCSRWPQINL